MAENPSPIAPADNDARAMAQNLLQSARHAALAYTDPKTGTPGISRIAIGLDPKGFPITLISQLSAHHAALSQNALAAVMVGEPGAKGDPLTHPRLMIHVKALFLDRADPNAEAIRALWLRDHPKSKLYIDFADFGFVRLSPLSAFLNGGFGRAVTLAPADLLPQAELSQRTVT
ncbi:MAG: pyridoxamine 5-phosphate oxidase [Cereibacter sphaeroides]|uniref:Pyridoxamine 5-phosphate oxidase n=1 Tax=Cereibacter sphaeroides TaxID=1063 RepID=A0A2W5SC23_CERSP|nr:MAG: pyridoxamine 5-phosphate oxidase [Cereibacter sphaeroides]